VARLIEIVFLHQIDVVFVEGSQGSIGRVVAPHGSDQDEFEVVGGLEEGELVLLGLEVSGLSLDVGVQDPNEVRHGGRSAL
jgi:hypothetical protein